MESAAPTILWRLFKPGHTYARAVILPGGPPFTLAFFADEAMDRIENYTAIDVALFRADEIRQSLLADGWNED